MRRSVWQAKAVLILAATSAVNAQQQPSLTIQDLNLRNVHVNAISTSSIIALPLNSPPINGFVPQVVFGLTDWQDPNDISFAAHASTPSGNALPIGGLVHYSVATFDTGAQSHIIKYDDAQIFNLDGANRTGNYTADIIGATGDTETTDISDGLGIFMTGFSNATVTGGSLNPTPGTLNGQWNTSVLTGLADPVSALPNIIGSPMAAQYQTVIRNSQTRRLTVGSQSYQSPQVDFQALNTPKPAGYSQMALNVLSVNGVSPTPTYFPSLDNFNNWADNPAAPTFWASLFANANINHTGGSATPQLLFDTGAQVTVLSSETASSVGFFVDNPEQTPPDFTVEISGVGGNIEEVPGFFMNSLSLTTTSGVLNWTHVPVIVLDIIDPRDAVGFVPGILGMNLFTDRDLVINGGTGNPFVAIGPQLTAEWNVSTGGNWGDDLKWMLGVPSSDDAPANFLSKITSPQTINVDADYTMGSIKFDNANRYTLSGAGRLTLRTFLGQANINVASGSHTISAPMTFGSDTTITVTPVGSKLTISNDVIATGKSITKAGAGDAEMKNIRAAGLTINAGRMTILQNGSASATSKLTALSIAGGGKLDLKDNDLIVAGGVVGAWNGSNYTGVQGLVAAGLNGGDWGGSGIITSQTATLTGLTTLGVSTGQAALGLGLSETTTWSGQTVAGADVLVMYTYTGDASLDGMIDGTDYFYIDNGVSTPGADGFGNGDFNYDGNINSTDYFYIDSNIVSQGPPLASSAEMLSIMPIPEPSTLALLILASGSLLSRCRRE